MLIVQHDMKYKHAQWCSSWPMSMARGKRKWVWSCGHFGRSVLRYHSRSLDVTAPFTLYNTRPHALTARGPPCAMTNTWVVTVQRPSGYCQPSGTPLYCAQMGVDPKQGGSLGAQSMWWSLRLNFGFTWKNVGSRFGKGWCPLPGRARGFFHAWNWR